MRSAASRRHMVENQLRPNQVSDERVLAAMGSVPRELFVPAALAGIAYRDSDIEIRPGRWLMEPRVLGRLLDAARIGPSDLVLVLPGSSGYDAAIAARLADTVIAVEADAAMRASCADALARAAIDNVALVAGDPAQGHARQAPYDVILFTGAIAEVPKAIVGQLAPGGRLLAVIREGAAPGRASILLHSGNGVAGRSLFDAATPLLPEFARAPSFVF